ncbi:MAG TPA: ABC transporter permease [Candidatus Babeliales bacterium]|nr:ABC transporter permease [Candidatus Babeliales bacterium]
MKMRELFNQEFAFFMSVPALLWQVVFFYIPLAIILFSGFVKQDAHTFFSSLTLEHFSSFFDPIYSAIIARSFLLALVNASLSVLLAYPVAYYVAGAADRVKNILLFLLILPFWTNFLVQVYAWFFVLEKHGLINSVLMKIGLISQPLMLLNNTFGIYIVMLYCYFPFAVMPIYSVLEKLDKRMLEASYDLGATSWQTFHRVILPLSFSGVSISFFLVFIASFGEFVIPSLLGGGKQMYIGTLITHYFLVSRNYHLGSAFTLLTVLVLLVGAALLYSFIGRIIKRSGGA